MTYEFKVLVVENSRTTIAHMAKVLKEAHIDADFAHNGQEAIDKVRDENFNVVVMDLYMPRLNGYEAAATIRALPSDKKNIPIIALTASRSEKDRLVCVNAGMNEYMTKDQGEAALIEMINRYRSSKDEI